MGKIQELTSVSVLDPLEIQEGPSMPQVYGETIIHADEELSPPPTAISIGTYSYKGNPFYIPWGTYGNFSCIVGASKARKSFLKSAIIAGYIGGKAQMYFPEIRGHETEGKIVLDIDTEQSKWHTQRAVRRVVEMVGSPYDNYKAFFLREQDAKIRFEFIEYLVMDVYRDKVGLVCIDGAADILESVNDLDLSNKIVQGMMRWTSKSNCHVLTVLHRNHGSDKPTGHLGSAIMKKAETVAFVEKNDMTSSVTANYTRNYPFEPFEFEVLEDSHLPSQINVNEPMTYGNGYN